MTSRCQRWTVILGQNRMTVGRHLERLIRLAACLLRLVVLAGVSQYESEVRAERQHAGIAKAKAEGKRWGGRKPGTRIRLSIEKEALIRQLHAEGKAIAAIARLVGLSRLKPQVRVQGPGADEKGRLSRCRLPLIGRQL